MSDPRDLPEPESRTLVVCGGVGAGALAALSLVLIVKAVFSALS